MHAELPSFEVTRSDRGVVVWESVAGWLRVVAMGPAPGTRELSRAFRRGARSVIRDQFHAVVPDEDPAGECERVLRSVDREVRAGLPEGDTSRATMVVAVIHGHQVWVAHTGDGAACLMRDGELRWLLASPDATDASSDGVELQPGDRLLMASCPAVELQRLRAFGTLLQKARPEDAAQELGAALAVQRQTPQLAVSVVAWDDAPAARPAFPAIVSVLEAWLDTETQH